MWYGCATARGSNCRLNPTLAAETPCFTASRKAPPIRSPVLREAGVKRYRIELVRETAQQTYAVVAAYRELLADHGSTHELRRRLHSLGLPMVRGTLRVIG